ncbi:glycosyltransferase family 2 protein [Olivibacter sp. CPCC 100613]|uniref:glycosyltransferase family 2 protein n=1 Tax=Olivibacter sp. CPCC 100613 TaxID=3079931 RepID=UPI002FFA4440
MVLVSVALCTYNGEKFIRKQINSILSQTYKNIEVVIVDDASSDSTLNIIEEFTKRDARIKCFRNPANIGFNANFEKAIRLCSGDYIAISDQDDIWLPNKIQVLLEAIGENLLVHSNSVFIDENDNVLQKYLIDPSKDIVFHNYKGVLFTNYVTGHTCLMRKELANKILPFPKQCFYDWWIGFVAAYEQKIVFKNAVLTKYREHSSSVITQYREKISNNRYLHYRIEMETVNSHLEAFSMYKNLYAQDKSFLVDLYRSHKKRQNSFFAFSLFSITYKNFKQLFPSNDRSGLRKLSFLFRYCRGKKMLPKSKLKF